MYQIFISYRRDTTGGWAQPLADRLRKRFGAKRVFLDTSEIEPGSKFPDKIDQALHSCKVLLAVIGPDWLDRRLASPEDWVHREIATALSRENVKVYTVFVGSAAKLQDAARLPDALKVLVEIQAFEIRDDSLEFDTARLAGKIAEDVGSSLRYRLGQRSAQLKLVGIAAAALFFFMMACPGGESVSGL